MLDRLVDIYSVDTSNFYDNKEAFMHRRTHRLRMERSQLVNGYVLKDRNGKAKRTIVGTKEMEGYFEKHGMDNAELQSILKEGLALLNSCTSYENTVLDDDAMKNLRYTLKEKFDFSSYGEDYDGMCEKAIDYIYTKKLISIKNEKIKKSKDELLQLLSNKTESNIHSNGTHHVRVLKENTLSDKKNKISVFDSYFTRTIGAKPKTFSDDFMVVKVFFFDMIKDLIYHGFYYKGEKYVYFTSSAGQIRTKKCVFVKESVWNKYEKSLMCGLTIDDINDKGGNNPNKHLAYLALTNSATDVWKEFDINKTIVIDDFETEVFGEYDLVDDTDYSINRTYGLVPITHTDGAGMMLPNAFGVEQKNKMVRLPWVKGLLGVFDFRKFIDVNGCSPIIEDIYGVKHDVIAEDIQVIFTKSQFKMWKYYDSWNGYKMLYEQWNCSAGVTNVEKDKIKNATINYQMLQSLTDITDDDIKEIAKQSRDRLGELCPPSNKLKTKRSQKKALMNIKNILGINPYNENKSSFQQAVELYPDLLNDEYAKKRIRDTKNSMINKYKSGKLQVHGKYTFILPDFYAACQHWFMGIENSEELGLLEDGEVFCRLFERNDKLDCLRSPHLFLEHAIRNNVAWRGIDDERRNDLCEWFCTNAIYTSCKDMISKVLMFDVDGDCSLVVSDKTLIKVAEDNIKKYDIVPLYYNMRKAEPVHLNNASIYNGLNAAFVGGNIGIYSNNISKIWNSDVFISGTDTEKVEAIKTIKRLCMENNFVIDYAKTLYKPKRPNHIDKQITDFTKQPLPRFFKYAKDKKENQVADANQSFVNKLDNKDVIPNPRINVRNLGLYPIDHTLLMNDQDIECKVEFTANGKLVKEETDPLIVKYCEFDKEYYLSIDNMVCQDDDVFMKHYFKNKKISDEIKSELSQFGYSDDEITDILVKYLYDKKSGGNKTALWMCYGDKIVENLKSKGFGIQTKAVQCVECGEWFDVSKFDSSTPICDECRKPKETKFITCCDCGEEFEVGVKDTRTERCENCVGEYKRKRDRERKRKQRESKVMSHDQTLPPLT